VTGWPVRRHLGSRPCSTGVQVCRLFGRENVSPIGEPARPSSLALKGWGHLAEQEHRPPAAKSGSLPEQGAGGKQWRGLATRDEKRAGT